MMISKKLEIMNRRKSKMKILLFWVSFFVSLSLSLTALAMEEFHEDGCRNQCEVITWSSSDSNTPDTMRFCERDCGPNISYEMPSSIPQPQPAAPISPPMPPPPMAPMASVPNPSVFTPSSSSSSHQDPFAWSASMGGNTPSHNYLPAVVNGPAVANCALSILSMSGMRVQTPDFSHLKAQADQNRREAEACYQKIQEFQKIQPEHEKYSSVFSQKTVQECLQAGLNRVLLKKTTEVNHQINEHLRDFPLAQEIGDEFSHWKEFSQTKKQVVYLAQQYALTAEKLNQHQDSDSEALTYSRSALQSGLEDLKESAHIAGGSQQGDFQESYQNSFWSLEIAKSLLDIGLGIDPVTGFGRSTYELFIGKNIVTGEVLSKFERGVAFVGVMSLGVSNSARAATKMFHVFEGASKILKESQVFQAVLHEGQVLYDKVPHLVRGFTKHAQIKSIHTAEHINQTHFARWAETPPFQLGSHVVESKTFRDTTWVRVHSATNPTGEFVMRKSAISSLTPAQIKDKFALTSLPTHVSDVHVPKGNIILRGNIQNHGLGKEGSVQYWVKPPEGSKRVPNEWFKNMREL